MTRVAIGGLGTIGRAIARRLADGMPGLTLACAAARDRAKAQAWLKAEAIDCALVELEAFPRQADLAIECALLGTHAPAGTSPPGSPAPPISWPTASRSTT